MHNATTHLVWFRNDLRITDNKALYAACNRSDVKVLAVFIATPKQWRIHSMAPRQAALIYSSLNQLKKALAQKGIPLCYHQCDDFTACIDWITDYCIRQRVTALFYNRQYELNEWQRDQKVEKRLLGKVLCQNFDDSLLLPPGSVHTKSGKIYKVYTPFRDAFIRRLIESDVSCLPAPKSRSNASQLLDTLLESEHLYNKTDKNAPSGEQAALERLKNFCRKQIQCYSIQRNFPSISGTSSLSPCLAIGLLSPRQCFNRLRAEYPAVLEERESCAFNWLNSLIWREFYRNLIRHYPELCKHKPFIAWTDKIHWKNDELLLKSWERGETGYPIVDAAMRQLNNTGWMHNRLRMVSASFLVKDLLIDWRVGERYFMSQLLDGDLAANNGGWQWSASTGTDSSPYFRIFNPTRQSERFDPEGVFIRKWLPELADVPNNYIHQPHLWAQKYQILLNYPRPIVDHAKAIPEAMLAFDSAKRRSL